MQKLKTNFKRYRWLLLLLAGIGGALRGDEVVDQFPPGTDLVSAIIAIYALSRNEREQVAAQVVERIWQRIGEVVTTIETNTRDVEDLRKVVAAHAQNIENVQDWGHNWGPFEPQPVLRPAAR